MVSLSDKDRIKLVKQNKALSKANESLASEVNLLRMMLDSYPESLQFIDSSLTFAVVNKSTEERLGRSKDELIGSEIFRFLPPDIAVEKKKKIDKVFQTGTPLCFEEESNGRIFENHFHPCAGTDEKVSHIAVASIDITDRKREEAELLKYKSLFGSESDFKYTIDPEGKILSVNNAAAALFNKKPEDVINKNIREFFPENIAAEYLKNIRRGIERGICMQVDNVINAGGKKIWINTIMNPVTDDEGRITAISGISRNITDLKREETLFRLHSTIMSNLSEGICLTRAKDNIIIYANPRFEKMFGYNTGELIGKPVSVLNAPTHLSPEKISEEINVFLNKGKGRFHGEIENLRKDGSRFWSHLSISTFSHPDFGRVHVAVHTDITDLINVEMELQSLNTELKQMNKIVSHDLQAPLSTLILYLQLLQKRMKYSADSDIKEKINVCVNSAESLSRMFNDILHHSQESYTEEDFSAIIDCNKIVEVVLNNLKKDIDDNSAVFTIGKLPAVKGNEIQLTQLFQNFISNAIKFRSAKSPRIHIYATEKNRNHIFSISDNGIGFDSENSDRIFLMFERLNNNEKYPGTGIGLALCKKIVKRHKGTVWAESQPGKGSVFYFSLPALERV